MKYFTFAALLVLFGTILLAEAKPDPPSAEEILETDDDDFEDLPAMKYIGVNGKNVKTLGRHCVSIHTFVFPI